jgi:hypothetical protein
MALPKLSQPLHRGYHLITTKTKADKLKSNLVQM